MPNLTYKSASSGRVHAVYSGKVRIGYLDQRSWARNNLTHEHYTWQLIMLKPEGGVYCGKAITYDQATTGIEQAWREWCLHAGLPV